MNASTSATEPHLDDDVRLAPNSVFLPACAVALSGWAALFLTYPKALPVFTFAAICILWAAYRLPFAATHENLSTFFLYDRKMPRREFVGTLVTTNIGFFSSVAFSTLLIASFGVGPAIISVIVWIGGLYAFSTQIEKLMPFFRTGSTLHEYIGNSFGKSDGEKRKLAFLSSVITFLLYIASVGVEIKFASDVFSPTTGMQAPFLAMLICISGIFYVAIAGYRGVVSTDRLRMWAVLMGVPAIAAFVYLYWPIEPIQWPDGYFSLQNMTIGMAPLILPSVLVLLALYQFCVMDMWERCIAIVRNPLLVDHSDQDKTELEKDRLAASSIKKMLVRDSAIPFILLFAAWYAIGLLSVAQNWTENPNEIIPILFQKVNALAALTPVAGYLIGSLLMLCFLSAALSTVDGFLIAAVQTVVCDWAGFKANGPGENSSKLFGLSALLLSRLLVVVCGVFAVTIAFWSFDLMSFWVGMYSLMLSFFPPIFFALRGKVNLHPSAGFVGAAIFLGSAAALTLSILGTFFMPNSLLSPIAPFAALGVSFVVMIGGIAAQRGSK